MSLAAVLALVAALVASAGYGSASVLQALGARRTAAAGGAGLGRQPLFVAGVLADAASWVVSLVALRSLPLFCVQALLAASLAVTAVLGRRVLGTSLTRADTAAVVVVVTSLAAVAAASAPGRASAPPPGAGTAGALVLLVLAAALTAPARVARGPRGAGLLAAGAALAYSLAALAARVASAAPLGAGWARVLGQPAWLLVLGAGGLGTVLYGRSLTGGHVVVATAVLWVVEAVAGGGAGLVLLGDGVRAGRGWEAAGTLGVVLALTGCAVLARPAAAASSPPSSSSPTSAGPGPHGR